MKWLILVGLLFAGSAHAQTVSVKSGEHGPFTRLVLQFPRTVDWMIGRSDVGYGLRIEGPQLTYNLSSVYDLITKDRLRSIWVDPATGDLALGVNCPCHVIPFELAGNTLVIDIRDGAPPDNSVFEISLETNLPVPPLAAAAPPRPVGRPAEAAPDSAANDRRYDWLADLTDAPPTTEAVQPDRADLEKDLRLEDFRTMLIEEVGRGATQGVIEMERPKAPVESGLPEADPGAPPQNARAALEALPGVSIAPDREAPPNLTTEGELCPDPADVDVGQWSAGEDPAAELAQARANLLTEFDVPDPTLVANAIKTHLFYGFGAESRSLLGAFLPPGQERPLQVGLSFVLDGEIPPQNPFVSMQSCDSAAALWALLAASGADLPGFVNGAAVSRTFLGLPPHLRAFLGPETAQRLLRSGDSANAEVVRQSFERSVAQDDPSVGLLAAEQALAVGDPEAAEAILPEPDSGDQAMAVLIAKVEARFQQRKATDGADIVALEAFAFEHGDGPQKGALTRALAHASALAGDFRAAFAHAGQAPDLQRDLWSLLADLGMESDVLTFAVGLAPADRDALPLATRNKIAERLLESGLPNAAAAWVDAEDADNSLAARVALANGDARAALRRLAAAPPEAGAEVLGASYAALGAYAEAAQTYETAGNAAEAERVQRWNGVWPSAPAAEGDPWASLAALLADPGDAATQPPLQAGQSRLDQSAATRQAVADLLQTAPAVPPEGQ